jgi:hypothetical protein
MMRALPIAGLALATVATAQNPPWNIPHRGALVYQRTTETFRLEEPPAKGRPEIFLKSCEAGGQEWRYCAYPQGRSPAGFAAPDFDDSTWSLGTGMFGGDTNDKRVRTKWTAAELCLRTHIDIGRRKPKLALFRIHHDDGVRVYCNGVQVVSNDDVGSNLLYPLEGKAVDAFVRGDNVIAVQGINTGGAQYLDVELRLYFTLPSGARNGAELVEQMKSGRAAIDHVHGDLFGAFRPPPMLLQGELDAAQERVRMPPGDLREIAWFAAMDLSKGVTGGVLQMEAPRMYRLGDLVLRGHVDPVDADGWQQMDLQVKNLPEPLPRDDSKRYVERWVKPNVQYGFDGRLRVRRRIDLADGKARVEEFHTDLQGMLLRGKNWKEPAAGLRQAESWKVAAVRDNQDAEFRSMVRKALDKACAHLRSLLDHVDGDELKPDKENSDRSYNSGRLAIGLLALLKGGVGHDDSVVQKVLQVLRQRTLVDTYSLGNAIMAIEAYYSPPNELADLKTGVIGHARQRTLPPEDLQLVSRWTDQLLQNVDTRVDPAYELRFNYVRGGRYDHSVNQYGLLGLYSAHLCGVPISVAVWEAAANHLIAYQGEGTKRVDLDLVDFRTLARIGTDKTRRTASHASARAAGWYYGDPKEDGEQTPRYGSMTAAGITGLSICQAAMLDYPGVERSKLQNDATAARNAGFAWFALNLQTRYHPGGIDHQQHWLYYYLYGLERAAMLSGIALIQDRDWYFEGAMVLVLTQQDDGTWPGEMFADQEVERDAMAILFLKQSTLPVLTGQ